MGLITRVTPSMGQAATPMIGYTADGQPAMVVEAHLERGAAELALARLVGSGQWGRFEEGADVSAQGWSLDLVEAQLNGQAAGSAHVVVAEFDPSSAGSTADGEHFLVLGAYAAPDVARGYAERVRKSGEWGSFCAEDAWSDAGWAVEVEEVELLNQGPAVRRCRS